MEAATGAAVLAFLGLWIAATVWVFVDAEENSSQSAGLWDTIALLFGPVAALVYALVGRDEAGDDRRSVYENP